MGLQSSFTYVLQILRYEMQVVFPLQYRNSIRYTTPRGLVHSNGRTVSPRLLLTFGVMRDQSI
jgi:hypothetical protein